MPIIWENEEEKIVKIPRTREEALEWFELTTSASKEKIKKVYHKLAQKWHPDRWSSKPKSKQKEANDIFSAIGVAFEILNENDNGNLREFCSLCNKEIVGEAVVNGMKGVFCSQEHADECLEESSPDRPCKVCWEKHNEDQATPEKCEELLKVISELKGLSHWYSFSDQEKRRFSVDRIQNARDLYFPGEDFNQYVEQTLKKAKVINEDIKNGTDQERNKWIGELRSLDGWDLIEEIQQLGFIENMERGANANHFRGVLQMAKGVIKKLRGDDEEDEERLKVEIQKVIQEVKIELSRKPKVSEEGLGFSWKSYLQKSVSLDQLIDRKEKVIGNIQAVRRLEEQGDLNQFRKEVIIKIRRSLSEDPPIETEELSIPDWEEKINRASSVGKINLIRSAVLAEISGKRNKDFEKDSLGELLLATREPQNWNNPQSLVSIIQQIKQFRTSDSYLEKESEVRDVEEQLRVLDEDQYGRMVEQLLDELVEDNGLNDGNLGQETRQAIGSFKANSTVENQENAERLICQNGADEYLIKLFEKVETKIKKGTLTEEKRNDLIDEIQKSISKNYYQRTAYSYRKQQVDDLLERLANWEEQDNDSNKQSSLPNWFWPVAVASCLGVVVVSVVLWIKGRNKEKSNHNKY